MNNFKNELVEIKNKEHFLVLDKFANENWGEHSPDGSPELDFFDVPKWAVVAKHKNQVVGLLFLFPREVIFEKEKIKFVGIGGVVTNLNFRHLGIATSILKFALDFCKKQGFDVAILCTDVKRLGKLYKNVGFVKMKRQYFFVDKNGTAKIESGGMICKLNSDSIFKGIQNSQAALNVGISNF